LFDLGEIHVSRASWLLKDGRVEEAEEELLQAAGCYHASALRTHQFSPNHYLRYLGYHSLAVTLTRLEDFEMAKRAFL